MKDFPPILVSTLHSVNDVCLIIHLALVCCGSRMVASPPEWPTFILTISKNEDFSFFEN